MNIDTGINNAYLQSHETYFKYSRNNASVCIRSKLPIIIPLVLPLRRRRRSTPLTMLFPNRPRIRRSRGRRVRQRRHRRTLAHSRSPDNVGPRTAPLVLSVPVLRAQGRKVVPEVAAFGLDARPGTTSAAVVGSFDKAVELVCGAADTGLEVLAQGCGVDAGLGCEVGFRQLSILD